MVKVVHFVDIHVKKLLAVIHNLKRVEKKGSDAVIQLLDTNRSHGL